MTDTPNKKEITKKRLKMHLHNLSLCLADAQETIKRFEKELEPTYVYCENCKRWHD